MKVSVLIRFAVISVILAGFACLCSAEELSSIKIKRIQDAIDKIKSQARGTQRKGYKEIEDLGKVTIPYLVSSLADKEMFFESKALICDLLGEMKAQEAVSALINCLGNVSGTVRASAARALGNIGDNTAAGPLMERFGDEDPQVREFSAKALINLTDQRIAPSALKLLGDQVETVRIAGATLLAEKADPISAEPLRKSLEKDKSAGVRMMAARGLGNIKDKGSLQSLSSFVVDDLSESVRQECAISLGKLGENGGIPALIQALNDDYKDVQLSAAESLKKLTGQDFGRDAQKWQNWYSSQGGGK